MCQVSFNYLLYFQRYTPAKFNIAKIRNENNSVNTDNRVMYFTFCSSPQGPLSLFQVTFIYLQYFQRYKIRTNLLLQKLGRATTL